MSSDLPKEWRPIHTPGPWFALEPLPASFSDHGYRKVATVRSMDICAKAENMFQEGKGYIWGSSKADATLMAAAPEMLQLLEHLEEQINSMPHGDNCFVSEHYEGDPGDRCNCGKEGLLERISAVIAKARVD